MKVYNGNRIPAVHLHAGQFLAVFLLAGLMTASRAQAGFQYQVLKSFDAARHDGWNPNARLREASDGALYGTSRSGNRDNAGTVFKINKDGSGFTTLHVFGSVVGDLGAPAEGVVEGTDGAVYGTTMSGFGKGTVFKLNKDGSGYTILHRFVDCTPFGLLEGSDGALYGLGHRATWTSFVFKLNKDGTGYSLLSSLTGNAEGLIKGADGDLYGTTRNSDWGSTVFKLCKDGSGYTILHWFPPGALSARMCEGRDGVLYGTTQQGGSNGVGSVFRLHKDGSGYAILHSFGSSGVDGLFPASGVVEGDDDALYGTAWGGGYTNQFNETLGTVFKLNKDGSGFSVLHQFGSSVGDGYHSDVALERGSDGKFYGTTFHGGSNHVGTVFTLNSDGTGYGILRHFGDNLVAYIFTAGISDRAGTFAGLIEGRDGGLYGTTYAGGTNGHGTVFKLKKDGGGYTVLRHFSGGARGDASGPETGLAEGSDGALYGVTRLGGSNNLGAVFRLSPDASNYAVIHHFGNSGDGTEPRGRLLQASDGALYGTTYSGGNSNLGTMFKLNHDGTGYSILRHGYRNSNFELGSFAYPKGGLIEATNGALYGFSESGLFRMNKDGSGLTVMGLGCSSSSSYTWPVEASDGAIYGTTQLCGGAAIDCGGPGGETFTANTEFGTFDNPVTLHVFEHDNCGSPWDEGEYPYGGLAEGRDGLIYGTTSHGGRAGAGAVFSHHKDGSDFLVLHYFSSTDRAGANPYGTLLAGSDGAIYGTTWRGGDLDFGTIFVLRPAPLLLPPVVSTAGVLLRMEGRPGTTNNVQRTTTLDGNWQTLTWLIVPTNGVAQFIDAAPPQPSAFYRAIAR